MLTRLSSLALIALIALTLPLAVAAQSAISADLSVPQTQDFPRLSAYLDVRDEGGNFISTLSPSQVTVLENGVELRLVELVEQRPGVQFVLAINPATSLGIRDSQGITRYGYVASALGDWAASNDGDQTDDLSLVTPLVTPLSHQADPVAWAGALQAYQPDWSTVAPSLDSIARAIDLAADPTPRPGMGRLVLWLTPLMAPDFADAIQNLADRATQTGVRVFIVAIDSPTLFEAEGAAVLRAFAQQTGGQFFTFSGVEQLPDFDALLEDQGKVYLLSYLSQLTTTGVHQISARIQRDDFSVTTPPQTFELQLQPPNPIFVSPVTQILRTTTLQDEGLKGGLSPQGQAVEIYIEFPDSIERALTRTTLYANGQIVAENTSPPFNRFDWDLSAYDTNQDVFLVAEAVDELGLSGLSIEIPVQIIVQQPRLGWSALLADLGSLFAIGGALLAGVVLLLVLVLSGRLRPQSIGERASSRAAARDPLTAPASPAALNGSPSQTTNGRRKPSPHKEDPVTQPVKSVGTGALRSGPLARIARRFAAPRLPWPQQQSAPKPLAYLLPLSPSGAPLPGEPAPITADEVTFGTDPLQATQVIAEPSVDALHARLWRDDEGAFRLSDQSSIAGTWVNYAPVSKDGSRLQHGDLIHIGRVGFRFTLPDPLDPPQPLVIRQEHSH